MPKGVPNKSCRCAQRSTRPSEAPIRCGLSTASPWTSATRAAASSPRTPSSVGCHMPQALRERYGLECVPIPWESLHLYCITRRGDRQREEVARYIKLLEGELDEA